MPLSTHRWGTAPSGDLVVCIHGVTQHGRIFAPLGQRLADAGRLTVAVDLRGHGASRRKPPWDVETHLQDLLETVDALGIERATWIGHSFGGRLVAELAARHPDRVERLALLDPGLQVTPEYALASADMDRLDWSFATVDGAVNALLSSDTVVAAPRATIAAYAQDDLRKGGDGRLRFRYSPSAVVVAWSEMARPAPPIARLPTLLVRPQVPLLDPTEHDLRYRAELGDLLTVARVPNGHSLLWESPAETIAAIEGFLRAP